MTVQDLHDALNLLPGDLVTAVDRLRTAPRTAVRPWKRLLPMAACLVLLLSVTLVLGWEHLPGMGGSAKSTAQAPMAAAPMEQEMAADERLPETPAMDEPAAAPAEKAPAAGSVAGITDAKLEEEELCIDHSHRFAEETETDRNAVGYCGNMLTTVYLDGEEFTITGSDSVTLTDILVNLDYDPHGVCRCMADITVDTEMLTGIAVNLEEGFARCEQGQAALTRKQADAIREILERLS